MVMRSCCRRIPREFNKTPFVFEKTLYEDEEEKRRFTAAALKACSICKDIETGKLIHTQACSIGQQLHIIVANSVLNMYAKCGSIELARAFFDCMPERTVVSWNSLIIGYVANGESRTALELFASMKSKQEPNSRTYIAATMACGDLGKSCLETGRMLHSEASRLGYDSDIFLANTLIDMYAKCRSMCDARAVFERICPRTVVSWNILIQGYVENGEADVGLELLAYMKREECSPDSRTFVALLMACGELGMKEEGQTQADGKLLKCNAFSKGLEIHSEAKAIGHDKQIFVQNTLIDMYTKCGSLQSAIDVFDRMAHRDVVSWNALLVGYAENGLDSELEKVSYLFGCMLSEGIVPQTRTFIATLMACARLASSLNRGKVSCYKRGLLLHSLARETGCDSDMFVASTLMDMYAKSGAMKDARAVFDSMVSRDTVSWNVLIVGYSENNEPELALHAFADMQCGDCIPDGVTFLAAIAACEALLTVEVGRAIHAEVYRYGLEESFLLMNSLVDFYGKCGSMSSAEHLFDSLTRRNLVTWSSMMEGYSRNGYTDKVFDVFGAMECKPDASAFSSVLSTCSHAGLVDRGMQYFGAMWASYGVAPDMDHYHVVVDMLGRANRLDEALKLVRSMPFEPTHVTWTTVLSACRKWKNGAVGKVAFDECVRIDGRHSASYLLMASIYGATGMREEQENVLAMRDKVAR